MPGWRPIQRRNTVIVNERTAKIPDYLFAVFLRLVVALKKGEGGWLRVDTLIADGLIGDAYHGVFSNLRHELKGCVEHPGELIEGDGKKHYRLSTHPDLVTYVKENLLRHPHKQVGQTAAKLP